MHESSTLAVIQEQLKNIIKMIEEIQVDYKELHTELKENQKSQIEQQKILRDEIEKKYVQQKDIVIIMRIVYGFAGVILTGAAYALVRLVIA